jgi:polynucleotide 5'-kinase involved in rRNA processing
METDENGQKTYLYPNWTPKASELLNIKTIMVIGETGSGKTTLLNAMVNYLNCVEMHFDFRYKLVDERQI